MYEEALMAIGLSLNEARVYEAMLGSGEASVQEISLASRVHRRNVYDALAKLIEKGLASEKVVGGEKHFLASDPKRLGTIIQMKQDMISHLLPEMEGHYHKQKQQEQAYVYRGVQGFRNYMQDIIDAGEDFYCVGAKGGWFDPRLSTFRHRFYKEFNKKKLNAYHLFDHEMREHLKQEVESPVKMHLSQSRFLPPECTSNAAIDIFADRVVTFTGLTPNHLNDNMVQFVLVSRDLAEAYKKWFWLMWDRCKE